MVTLWMLCPEFAEGLRATWLMKANCAFCLAAGGAALALNDDGAGRHRPLTVVLLAAVALLATLTLLQYAAGIDFGIDTLLVPGDGSRHHGRMAPQTAIVFLVFAIGLFLANRQAGIASHVSDGSVIAIAAVLHAVLAGYFHHNIVLTGPDADTRISPQALVYLSVIWTGLLFSRTNAGFFQILTGEGRGSIVLRYLLPPVVVMPIAISSVRLWLEAHGWHTMPFAASMFATAQSLVRIAVVVALGVLLNRSERQRREERTRREEAERLIRICAWTSRVRWQGRWVPVDVFLKQRFNLEVTHGISEEAMAAALEEVERRREHPERSVA